MLNVVFLQEFGLGESLKMLNAGGGVDLEKKKKKSMSPMKITATVGASSGRRRKKSGRRSRSASPKRLVVRLFNLYTVF